MLKITILISKDYNIDIYKISRYIAKAVVLLSPTTHPSGVAASHGYDVDTTKPQFIVTVAVLDPCCWSITSKCCV